MKIVHGTNEVIVDDRQNVIQSQSKFNMSKQSFNIERKVKFYVTNTFFASFKSVAETDKETLFFYACLEKSDRLHCIVIL